MNSDPSLQSVTAHLEEIRGRLLLVFLSFFFFFGLAFMFMNEILWILKMPAGKALETLVVFSPTAAILSFLKIAMAFGTMISLPIFLYQAWMFILPAVAPQYGRQGFFFIVSGTALFVCGVMFSFYVLIPTALTFLLNIGKGQLQFMIALDAYVSFVLLFLIGGGLVFEMPILVYCLCRVRFLTARRMLKGWRAALVGILITAALVTPTPDAVNMILMALPMSVLYVVSIGVAFWTERT